MRKFHKISGLVSAVFLVVLAISGIYLHYAAALESDALPRPVVIADIGGVTWIGTKEGVFKQDKAGNWTPATIRYPQTVVADIAEDNGAILVAFQDGAIFRKDTRIWRRLDGPNGIGMIRDIDPTPTGLRVVADNGIHRRTDIEWIHEVVLSGNQAVTQWMLALHTGQLWPQLLPYLYDISSIILIGLVITGVQMSWKMRRRKKRPAR